jgi:protein-tyrosine phosphatase
LLALGVARDAVYDDFLASNIELADPVARIRARLAMDGIDPDVVEPMLTVRASYLDTALAEVDRSFGSIEGYLVRGLGLDVAVQRRLRSVCLLDPAEVAVS